MAEVYTDLNEKNKIARVDISDKRVIPVILLPGIMGSNLKVKRTKKQLWRVDGVGSLLIWTTQGAKFRKNNLHPKKVSVDNRGKVKSMLSYASEKLKDVAGVLPGGRWVLKKQIEDMYKNNPENILFGSRESRGWGEVAYRSYGDFLDKLQRELLESGDLTKQLMSNVLKTEPANKEQKLQKEELDVLKKYLFPVHAIGYNWLDSNINSAQEVGNKIEKIIKNYNQKKMKCHKVILVTHSMGGLVARYYSGCLGGEKNIYGIVHGVMPSIGAAATYTRMKSGNENTATAAVSYLKGEVTAEILGKDAAEMTAICSHSPGPLELLPSKGYGMHWLRIQKPQDYSDDSETTPQKVGNERVLEQVVIEEVRAPKNDPYTEIYLQREKWWKLIDEELLNPNNKHNNAAIIEKDWGIYEKIIVEQVMPFHSNISGRFHPNTYSFHGENMGEIIPDEYKTAKSASWRQVLEEIKFIPVITPSPHPFSPVLIQPPAPVSVPVNLESYESKTALRDGRLVRGETGNVRTVRWPDNKANRFVLRGQRDDGDGTVPVHSGRLEDNVVKERYSTHVAHESCYTNINCQLFTLRSIIRIAHEVYNDKEMAF